MPSEDQLDSVHWSAYPRPETTPTWGPCPWHTDCMTRNVDETGLCLISRKTNRNDARPGRLSSGRPDGTLPPCVLAPRAADALTWAQAAVEQDATCWPFKLPVHDVDVNNQRLPLRNIRFDLSTARHYTVTGQLNSSLRPFTYNGDICIGFL